jgi:putative ATP-dependent endonuclease of the OLD family
MDQKWPDLRDRHIYFLDAGGKYNIHRYLALLSTLAIPHSVLIDGDCGRPLLEKITDYIKSMMTSYTIGHHVFESDIEIWLGIPAPPRNRNDMKPLNALTKVRSGEVSPERIDRLKDLLLEMCSKDNG